MKLDEFFRPSLERHVDTMNDSADSDLSIKEYFELIKLYESFIKDVKKRIEEMTKE
jgi:hypothetical protein